MQDNSKFTAEVKFTEDMQPEEKAQMIKEMLNGFHKAKIRRRFAVLGLCAVIAAPLFLLPMMGLVPTLQTILTYGAAAGVGIAFYIYLAYVVDKTGETKETGLAGTALAFMLGVCSYIIGDVKLSTDAMRSWENILFAGIVYVILTLAQVIFEIHSEKMVAKSLKGVQASLLEEDIDQ